GGVDLGELVERVADPRELLVVGLAVDPFVFEGDECELAAALLRLLVTRVVDDQPAHRPSRVRQEVRAIGERRALPPGDVEVGLMQKARRSDRQSTRVPMELSAGEAMELGVERREERVVSLAVAGRGGRQETGDFPHSLRNYAYV